MTELSTVIDTDSGPSATGGGADNALATETVVNEPAKVEPEKTEPKSLRDSIKEVVQEKKVEAEQAEKPEAKTDLKDEPEAKSQPEKQEAEPKDGEPEQSEKPKKPGHFEPPKKFLPDAKEVWRNVPRAVQRDIDNTMRQHEDEVTQLRASTERYESIREYDELAQSNGRDLKDSLAKVVEIEDALSANPIAGLNKILMEIGPRKADGQPVSLFEVAQYIVQSGQQGYQQMVTEQPQQAQQQDDPRIAQLQTQIQQMQEQQLAAAVIDPFMAENPRYEELQDDIALFLQSGKIPVTLSPIERLSAAYDMAVRINPASHGNEPDTDLEPAQRVANISSASKSIKSAPGAVSADMAPERGGSIRDILQAEIKSRKRSA